MAKKSRRVRRPVRPTARLSPSQMVQPKAGEVVTAPGKAPTSEPQSVDLGQEYHYVVADLKRIGIIAAVMLVALIVLAFALA